MNTTQNVYRASYTRPDARGQSAARLVRYLTRRPHDKEHPGRESEWESVPEEHTFGNAEAFKKEANRRRREKLHHHERNGSNIEQDHSQQNVSYLHVVISPRSREEFRSEDFEALMQPWIRDRKGRRCEHFAVIHYDDPEGPKMHLAIARDRIHKTKELPHITELTNELVEEREMLLERSRYPEHSYTHQRDLQQSQDHELTREETHPMQNQQREEERRREEEAQRETEQQARQQEETRREYEAQQEERQIEERRRQRLEREAQERDDNEHGREM